MKKLIGLSALALGILAQAGFAASVEQTHQAVANIMEGAAAPAAVPQAVQAGEPIASLSLEPVPLQYSLAPARLQPTLGSPFNNKRSKKALYGTLNHVSAFLTSPLVDPARMVVHGVWEGWSAVCHNPKNFWQGLGSVGGALLGGLVGLVVGALLVPVSMALHLINAVSNAAGHGDVVELDLLF